MVHVMQAISRVRLPAWSACGIGFRPADESVSGGRRQPIDEVATQPLLDIGEGRPSAMRDASVATDVHEVPFGKHCIRVGHGVLIAVPIPT